MKYGCTRLVILTKKYAIKIPQFKYEWRHFLLGLLCNMQEVQFSKIHNENRICPVLFHVPGGWLIVMPRCKELTRDEFFKLDLNRFWPIKDENKWKHYTDDVYNIPVENKEDSFGWYNGKIVAIDYGS